MPIGEIDPGAPYFGLDQALPEAPLGKQGCGHRLTQNLGQQIEPILVDDQFDDIPEGDFALKQ
jgi:hypothetical protein